MLRFVQEIKTAWDVDGKTGRIYLTQSVGGGQARIVEIQNWLADFEGQQAARR